MGLWLGLLVGIDKSRAVDARVARDMVVILV